MGRRADALAGDTTRLEPTAVPPTAMPWAPPADSTTEGVPGAPDESELPDLSDIPFDPRTAPRLPHPLPEHIARAGQQQFGGAIPTQGSTSGGTGGTVIEQPGLKSPPAGTGETTTASPPPPPPYPYPGGPGYPPSAGSDFPRPGYGGLRIPWESLLSPKETPPMAGGGPYRPPVTPPSVAQPPPQTPPGAQDVDLSGTWHATTSVPVLGNLRFTMTLSRVAAGKWQGPLDYVYVDCPELSFKTQATLQATGVGKVRVTYNTPAKECPRYAGRVQAGAVQADGTYTNSQITVGNSPNTVTFTTRK